MFTMSLFFYNWEQDNIRGDHANHEVSINLILMLLVWLVFKNLKELEINRIRC